jgi:hypothetical protein
MLDDIKYFCVEVVVPVIVSLAAVFLLLVIGGATISVVAVSLGYEPPDPHADYMDVCLQANGENDCELRYHEMKMVQDAIRHNNRRLDDEDAAAISAGYGIYGF